MAHDAEKPVRRPTYANNHESGEFLAAAKGQAITIGWMDSGRKNMKLRLVRWDTFNFICEGQDGAAILIPKHAVAFLIAHPTGEETASKGTADAPR